VGAVAVATKYMNATVCSDFHTTKSTMKGVGSVTNSEHELDHAFLGIAERKTEPCA